MKPRFNEDTLSEQPAIEQLKRLQYEYIHGDNLDPELKDDCERSSRREVVLIHRLKQKLAEINPHLTEESIDKAIRRITHIQAESLMEANQKFHQDLIAGISIDQDIGARRQKQTVRFIDFDDPEKNEFLAVNQFWVKGPKQTDRPDIWTPIPSKMQKQTAKSCRSSMRADWLYLIKRTLKASSELKI